MKISQPLLERWFKLARKAVKRSADEVFCSKMAAAGRKVNDSTGHDIKIAADKLSESIILDTLKPSNLPVLSEESCNDLCDADVVNNDILWIVDPLDGSLNFYRDIPMCCISIGLWIGKKPIMGAVYDFSRGELFSGICGKGAWLNKNKIHPSSTVELQQSVLCTGFPSHASHSKSAITGFVNNVRSFKKIRLLGSAALSLAYVACGRADAYMEKGIRIWDVAGGLAILAASGGRFDIKPAGKSVNSYQVVARNSFLKIQLER